MGAIQQRGEILRREPGASTNYNFYGISVEVIAESKDLIHALNHIFAHFMCGKEGKADLAVELSGKKRYLTASVRSGLKSFSFDTWPIALLTPSSSDGMRSYKVKSRLGFYELLRTAYFTVFSFVLANLGDFLQFHAGAVAKGEAGIIFPGGSGSGKTTLVLALTRAGYSFLSDEVCLIDPSNLTVSSFPRSVFLGKDVIDKFSDLKVGRNRGDIFITREKKCLIEIDKNSVYQERLPANIRYIVFPNYQPTEKTDLKEITENETIARLIAAGSVLNMTHLGADQGAVLDSIVEIVTSVPCFELVTSNLDGALTVINNLMI